MTNPVQVRYNPNAIIFIVFLLIITLLPLNVILGEVVLNFFFSIKFLIFGDFGEYFLKVWFIVFVSSMFLQLIWQTIKTRKINMQVDEEKISLFFSKETKVLYWHEIEKYACDYQQITLKPKNGSLFHLAVAKTKDCTNFQTLSDQIKKYSELYPSIRSYDFFHTFIGRLLILFSIPIFLCMCALFTMLIIMMLKNEQFQDFSSILSLLEVFVGIISFGFLLWHQLKPIKKK